MTATEPSTRSAILRAAEEEFLEKGFQAASLRSIVKKAGVTTGAFYGYYKSKEELFSALVDTQYRTLLEIYNRIQSDFTLLPADHQHDDMREYTDRGITEMTDYIFENLQAFKLILCCAEGTRYEHMVDDMARIDVDATHNFTRTMENAGLPVKTVNPQLEHMLTSGMFSAYFEIVIHDIPRAQAEVYISQLLDFYSAGWQKIMGL